MCILEKLNFKISRGSMPPDPPSLIDARSYFCQDNNGKEKGVPSVLYRDIDFKDC